MKKFFFFLISVLFLGVSSSKAQSQYVKKYLPLADSLSKLYQIPKQIFLGVAIIESGSGTSRNAKLLNNHFGIKGKNNLLNTKGIKSSYRQFPSVEAGYVAFGELISRKKFYSTLKGNPSLEAWADAISKSGYPGNPSEWKRLVLSATKMVKK
ncbi:MAG: muramidase [Ferruginibacter sp.]|nr:muramidase [Ferruginibacter sp.]